MAWSSRWTPLAASTAAAAALIGAAVVTVEQAGCSDPGRWLIRGGSVELVGGCLDAADLPVAPAPVPTDPAVPPASLGD